MKTCCIIVCCLFSTCVIAQSIRFSKLDVNAKESLTLFSDTTFIDTLILNDYAELRFTFRDNVLIVKNAFIGSGCIMNASGATAEAGDTFHPDGYEGAPGRNLTLILNLLKLGDITVSVQGGNGGKGINGINGSYNAGGSDRNGGNGGNGGRGGNGGSISFFYNTPDFLLSFNSKGSHVVNFNYGFGLGGKGGAAGKPGMTIIQQSTTPRDPKNPLTSTSSGNVKGRPGRQGLHGGNGGAGKLEFARMELKF